MKKKLMGSVLLGAMLLSTPTAALAQTMTIDLGNPVASVDADTYVMENVAGISEEGVILVPVREVAEAFDGTVFYNKEARMVKLTFPNGNWADISMVAPVGDAVAGETADSIVDHGTFIDDRLYIPATLMATCLGAHVELVDYGHDTVFRLIYHVR